jgi:hypothetical protein
MAYRPSHRLIISTVIILFVIGAFIVILPEIGRRAAVKQLERVFTVPVAIDDVDLTFLPAAPKLKISSSVIMSPVRCCACLPLPSNSPAPH